MADKMRKLDFARLVSTISEIEHTMRRKPPKQSISDSRFVTG